MPIQRRSPRAARFALAAAATAAATFALPISGFAAAHGLAGASTNAFVAGASDEGAQAIRKFRIPKGWKVDLIAAEPHLANPVAFAFDEQEQIYVVETFRLGTGVLDIRGRADWPAESYKKNLPPERLARLAEEVLDTDLACRTVEEREALLRMYFAENLPTLEKFPDRVRLLARYPDGTISRSTVFADGFSSLTDGLASGVLARGNDVWFANIPSLWKLQDTNHDGVADERTSLHHGYGVRVGFLGHDLHGLCFGPDGRIYFSIGDRGASVTTREGTRIENPDSGAIFRCDPDGSRLERVATGLRNPQELVFDDLGNLWTGDNNSDGGDQARWTYLVDGADCGWHIGWQYIESPNARGPWNAEGMWRPEVAARIGYIIPALANIGAGPSGITFNYGTGLPADLDRHFFMTDFRGGPSGIWTFAVQPKGAGYQVGTPRELLWNALPTDVDVGPDGGLYWSDWVQGWDKTGKGRIYRMYDPETVAQPVVTETRALLRSPLGQKSATDLAALLRHPDLRIRQRAQFALADQKALGTFVSVAQDPGHRLARLHAIWGLWQLGRGAVDVSRPLLGLLNDSDAEVRGQAARVLGDLRIPSAADALVLRLADPEPRPRFFAALALGHLGHRAAEPAIVRMLEDAGANDPFLRHAGVMGLASSGTPETLAALARHPSPSVRLAAVVALRRLHRPELAEFLKDKDPAVTLEAARAINDLPVPEAMPALASLLDREPFTTPLLRRALNAQLRSGTAANASALATFATRTDAPEAGRTEALKLLAQFPKPSGRDQVTGLWRPLPTRDASAAAAATAALKTAFPALLGGPESVQIEAAAAAARLDARDVFPNLRALARNAQAGGKARVAALHALGEKADTGMADLVTALADDGDPSVRAEVLRWAARLDSDAALPPIRKALEKGEAAEKQAALAGLATLKSPGAETLLGTWISRAADGQAPAELVLDLLEAGKARQSPTLLAAVSRLETSLAHTNPVTARRHLLRGGDAEEGRKVFAEKEAVQCIRCHKAGGDGGVVGPDLAGIGTRQTREYLLESIVAPNAAVAAGFENVMIELNDDSEYSGTVQKETDSEITLNTVENGTLTLKKSEIRSRRKGLSGMPEGLADILTPRELRDLVEYLQGLKAR